MEALELKVQLSISMLVHFSRPGKPITQALILYYVRRELLYLSPLLKIWKIHPETL